MGLSQPGSTGGVIDFGESGDIGVQTVGATAVAGATGEVADAGHIHPLAAPKLDDLATPDDNTDLDASTSRHGLLRKLPGGTTNFLREDGTFAAVPGGGVDFGEVGDIGIQTVGASAVAGATGEVADAGHIHALAAPKLDDLAAPDDNTDTNATTGAHGLLPKLGGGTTNYLRADGTWNAPPGGGAIDFGESGDIGVQTVPATAVAGATGEVADAGHIHPLAAPKLDDLAAPDDNTDLNATTSAHGLLKKLPGGTTTFLRGDGTFAAPPGGGGGVTTPAIIQSVRGVGTSVVLGSTPANGSRIILAIVEFGGGTVTAVASANTTWTQIGTDFSTPTPSTLSIWVGVCAASAGTTITLTEGVAGTAVSLAAVVADALTPTAGTVLGSDAASFIGFPGESINVTQGNFLAALAMTDNTSVIVAASLTSPYAVLPLSVTIQATSLALGYAPSGDVAAVVLSSGGSSGGSLIASIT